MSLNPPSSRSLRHSPSTDTLPEVVCEPSQSLTVAVQAEDRRDVVIVTGEVDVATAPRLAKTIRALVGRGRDLVIDLDLVSFIDSTGLNLLVATHRRVTAEGGTMAVVCHNARTWRVMQITGLTRLFTFQGQP